ncbi:killer toxin subunits alpha beta [Podospora aff. communis PSN243]|uniref:chitinase n=1 Tax=Podospora aff. communis PSN243 TaxID=3040156 RepID=A0AAV9H1X5_9PEZI|nr:killer toxin subunits alpha beta [Podospora aff. communis PSN243]
MSFGSWHGLPSFQFPGSTGPIIPELLPCPGLCDETGPTAFAWPHFSSVRGFARCKDTVIFDMQTRVPLGEKDSNDLNIRACSAKGTNPAAQSGKYGPVCLADAELEERTVDVELGWSHNANRTSNPQNILTALQHLRKNILEDPTCQTTSLFARHGDVVVGLYVGAEIRKTSAAPLIDRFAQFVGPEASNLVPSHAVAQVCAEQSAPHVFGVVYDTSGSLDLVHAALNTWSKAQCVTRFDDVDAWKEQKFSIIPALAMTMGADYKLSNSTLGGNSSIPTNSTTTINRRGRVARDQSPASVLLAPRADCVPVTVEPNDDCWSIRTQKCSPSVSESNFYKWNGKGSSDFCKALKPGSKVCCTEGTVPEPKALPDGTCAYVQAETGDDCSKIAQTKCASKAGGSLSLDQLYKFNGGSNKFCDPLKLKSVVCCTQGTKPDLRPKKNADGSCATHVVQKNQYCYDIQEMYMLEAGDIEKFNKKKTWGFSTCEAMAENMRICISDGDPPMPSPIDGASCGPQKPGTQRPTNGTKLADLNPCPLNTCCNIWGNCGTTADFCIDTSIDGAPGTAKKGTYGCISNCGMDIVNNDVKPAKFERIGYFEGWNKNRPCLHMDVTEVKDPHTIIHFAFGWINEDFTVSTKGVEEQFEKFKKMTGIKKVISYGGWAFSNEAPTSHIIRQAVRPENAARFAENVAKFVIDNNLDGVDFDWEYPGADDILGSDPGTPVDGANYLAFFKMMKRRLPGKTVSFASPASYWYLRHFPIAELAKVADYIVYMTYDLHGQWDVGGKYAAEGCEWGNCLRSHVNKTETINSLALITKAGVPAYKVFVGISSYGRSFKMAEIGCHGPDCLYLGERNQSPAAKGYCTGEGGYLADAEIRQTKKIAAANGYEFYEYYDEKSDSDILVYDNVEWVAYMDHETKERRVEWYKSLNFGGVSDWAVDLQRDASTSTGGAIEGLADLDLSRNCNLDKHYTSLDDLLKDKDSIDQTCLSMQTLRVLKGMLKKSLDGYSDAASGYDDVFPFYRDYMRQSLGGRLQQLMLNDDQPLAGYFKCYADLGQLGKRSDAWEVNCKDLPSKYMQSYTFFWEIHDRDGLIKALDKESIDLEWVEFGTWEDVTKCWQGPGGTGGCFDVVKSHRGFPTGKSNFDVPNPKTVVEKARDNFQTILNEYDDMYADMAYDTLNANPADVLEVLAVPVFMLEDAVAAMAEVKKLGKEVKKEKEKDLILKIIEGILFLIPFVGAAIGALGRVGAMMARVLMAVEAAGSAALGVYSLVEDPSQAPVAILTMVLGGLAGGAGTRGTRYRNLSGSKGKMTPEQKSTMGTSYTTHNPKVEQLSAAVCKRK